MLMVGEAERRARFGYALQQALTKRKMSERQLAQRLEVDPRRVAGWRIGKKLPDLYETQALAAELRVSEELFRNPPPVPKPQPYPIERYLLEAIGQGAAEGLMDELPPDEDGDALDEPPSQPRS
jgi:transcriptional regulator with XRE-family HTH domain